MARPQKDVSATAGSERFTRTTAIASNHRGRQPALWRIFQSRGFRVVRALGSHRYVDGRAVPTWRDGRIVEWVGACIDVTEKREADLTRGMLRERMSAAALRTARLQQATSMLSGALTVELVAEVISDVGRATIGAELSAVAIWNARRGQLDVIRPTGSVDGDQALIADLPASARSSWT